MGGRLSHHGRFKSFSREPLAVARRFDGSLGQTEHVRGRVWTSFWFCFVPLRKPRRPAAARRWRVPRLAGLFAPPERVYINAARSRAASESAFDDGPPHRARTFEEPERARTFDKTLRCPVVARQSEWIHRCPNTVRPVPRLDASKTSSAAARF
ncbi:hypothetical protein MTO96_020549 [Rhipicephalus appendiculatus]